MLTFKDYLLLESDDKIAYHLAKNPQHADFLNRYLGKDRLQKINRSKYLDWVIKGLNKPLKEGQRPVKPKHLGSQIDYFHSVKSKEGFTLHKDINRYSTHQIFIDSIKEYKNA